MNVVGSICRAVSLVCCSAALAAETEYEWSASGRRTEFGIARVSYCDDADTVSGISLGGENADSDMVVFTGEEPFAFAPGALIEISSGNLRFETPVAADDLRIRKAGFGYICSTNAYDDYLNDTKVGPTLLFPGRSVDDYSVGAVYFHSGAFYDTMVFDFGFISREPGRLTFEAQALDNGPAKGARITLFDGEEGIYGSVDCVGYFYGSAYEYSLADKDNVIYLPVNNDPVDKSGYAVRYVLLTERSIANEVAVKNARCDISSLSVESGTAFTLDGAFGEVTNALISLSRFSNLTLRDMEKADFAGEGGFLATNAVVSLERTLPPDPRPLRTVRIDSEIASKAGMLLLENAKVDEITAFDVPFLLNSVSRDEKPTVCFVKRSSGRIEFQVQVVEGGWLKGSKIELYQNGANIFVRKICSMYAAQSYGPAGRFDMLSADVELNQLWTDGANKNYCPGGIELTLPEVSVFSEMVELDVNFTDTYSRLLLPNTNVEDIDSVFAERLYGNMSTDAMPLCCFEKRSSDRYEFQLQVVEDAYYVKASRYVFEQKGFDVHAHRVMSYWATLANAVAPGVWDFTDPGLVLTGSTTGNAYAPSKLKVYLRRRPQMTVTMASMGTESAQNVTLNIGDNVTFTAFGNGVTNSLPRNGTVNVDGRLRICGKKAIGTGAINVRRGGLLSFEVENCSEINTDQLITLTGGQLRTSGSAEDGVNYLNSVVLNDGGRISGAGLRVGAKNIKWSAGGDSPSNIDSNIKCVSHPQSAAGGEFVMTWEVGDATGDAQTDLFMNGNMTDFEDGTGDGSITRNGGMVHLKTGEGTLRWGGVSTCTGMVRVAAGRLLIGNSKALNPGDIKNGQWGAKQPVEIAGGTLALEASVACTVSSLSLVASGALDLPAGSSLAVDAPGTFATGEELHVTLGEGASLSFGAPLAASQLRTIRVNGCRAKQKSDGTICEKLPPLTLILR